MLALLVLTACFAGAVLFLRFQLSEVRDQVQARASSFLGVDLTMDAVVAQGLRGLRIDGLKVNLGEEGGPSFVVEAPQIYIYIDFLELVYGRVVVDDVLLDGVIVRASRPLEQAWSKQGGRGQSLPGNVPFRIRGQRCEVLIENAIGATPLALHDLSFDVSRPIGGTDLTGMIKATWGDLERKLVSGKVRYNSPDDFDLRLQHEGISSDDIAAFAPGEDRFLESGFIAPQIRLSGYPNQSIVASVEASFLDLTFRGQPDFLPPATGTLKLLANYSGETRLLDLTTARVTTPQLSGAVDGTIDFSGDKPQLDLRLQADQIPFTEILDYALATVKNNAGNIVFEVADEYAVALRLQGTFDEPVFTASTMIENGAFQFRPSEKGLPKADLQLGSIDVSWDSTAQLPRGALRITGGTIEDPLTGISIENVSGSLVVADDRIMLAPLSATLTGNPIVGKAEYNLTSKAFTFALDGAIADLEELHFVKDVKKLFLSGSLGVRCNGTYKDGGLTMDMALDATQSAIGFDWWFRKPLGVGTTISSLNLEYKPNRAVTVSGAVSLGTSPINATAEIIRTGGKWELDSIRAKGSDIDAPTANKCLAVPYTLGGGMATEITFDYKREGEIPDGKTMKIAGHIDNVTILPDGGTIPILASDLSVSVFLDESKPQRAARADIEAGAITMPAFGELWFVPLESSDPELRALFPPGSPWFWAFTVNTSQANVPPWAGRDLALDATDYPDALTLKHFQANVGDGMLSGTYRRQKTDNVSTLEADWKDVPAKYLIEHIKLPNVLSGTATGKVNYHVDDDDPNTLKGDGMFEIRDGRFNPEFVFEQLNQTLQGDMNVLPPSLDFARFASNIALEGDRVTSNGLVLEGEGITITADGYFIIGGDMDYLIKISLSPQTAQQMPLINQYFNIQGHKLTQNTIDLEFRVNGPTFRPRGAVAGLPPVGVTLVSGAFEMTSEAVKIIDLPRQLLLDLFKIGGGIVGSQKQ